MARAKKNRNETKIENKKEKKKKEREREFPIASIQNNRLCTVAVVWGCFRTYMCFPSVFPPLFFFLFLFLSLSLSVFSRRGKMPSSPASSHFTQGEREKEFSFCCYVCDELLIAVVVAVAVAVVVIRKT